MTTNRAIGRARGPLDAKLFLLLAGVAAACGCGGGGGSGGGGSVTSNVSVLDAAFTYTPGQPTVGVPVQFTDRSGGNPTSWSWDFNSDGTIDATVPNPTITFGNAGPFLVTFRIANASGTDVMTHTINVAPAGGTTGGGSTSGGTSSGGTTSGGSTSGGTTGGGTTVGGTSGGSSSGGTTGGAIVDIDVDTNRDGDVSNTTFDEAGEDSFAQTGGAVFFYNVDDDDNNGVADAGDSLASGTDPADLARIVVRRYAGLPSTATVTIDVGPAAAQSRIRIFRNSGGAWSSVYGGGASFTLPAAAVAAGDVELGIEARARISLAWDGEVTLTLRIADGTTALGTDAVRLRLAPLLLADMVTWRMKEAVVVDIPAPELDNTVALQQAVQAACTAIGATFRRANGPTYQWDRWIQDSHEAGAHLLPAVGLPRKPVDTILQLARWREIDDWAPDVMWGPDFAFIARFSNSSGSLNYGGNLEIAPLHTSAGGVHYPWGRIVVGGGTTTILGTTTSVTDRMDSLYREFFDALGAQGPHVEISTAWLAVGHVDEYLMFVPAPARPRGWAVVFASPALARQLLQNVQNAGGGSKLVFAGRTGNWAAGIPAYQTTVSAILADAALMSYNNAAQARLDSIKQVLISQLGLSASDFVEVPVLFEDVGQGYAAAYNPGVANLIPFVGASGAIPVVVPDPEGPDNPTDVWQNEVRTKLQALGTAARPLQPSFVDVFNSYHIMLGEAHCGTNFVCAPPAMDWWDK